MDQLLAIKPELLNVKDSDYQTAFERACDSSTSVKAVATLVAHGAIPGMEHCLSCLQAESGAEREEIARLLLAYAPDLIDPAGVSLSFRHPTMLHYVFGLYNNRAFFSEGFMRHVWQLNPAALRATMEDGKTPFHVAIRRNNKVAIEMVQGEFSLDEIMSAYARSGKELSQTFWELLHDPLSASLMNKDLIENISEYLGFRNQNKHQMMKKKKRMREEEEEEAAEEEANKNNCGEGGEQQSKRAASGKEREEDEPWPESEESEWEGSDISFSSEEDDGDEEIFWSMSPT